MTRRFPLPMSLIPLFTIIFSLLLNVFFGIEQEVVKTAESGSVLPLRGISLSFGVSLLPIRENGVENPAISAQAAVVIDQDSGMILFQKSSDQTTDPASLTKIMTALVVLENLDLNTIMTVPKEAVRVEGSKMHLVAGERIRAEDLLKGMLIVSANDAALALALEVGESEADFVRLMNDKAQALNLTETHFKNPHGLAEVGHQTSALDLAFLTREALLNPTFAEIVKISQTTVKDLSGTIVHNLKNTNQLLAHYDNIIGVKTGTLENGASLVAAAQGPSDQVVITVLLNSPDRFREAERLLDWALKNYIWIGKL